MLYEESCIKALKNGEDLFFVDAQGEDEEGRWCWFRSPCMTKKDALKLITRFLTQKGYKNVNLRSEECLNEYHKFFDEDQNIWVDDVYSMREYLFGSIYQGTYEHRCEDAGVNLDLVSEWRRKRDDYKKLKNSQKEIAKQLEVA